jgi:hypothetical protein
MMAIANDSQQQRDPERLRLLAVFHYVVGGIGFLCACFPIIHVVVFGLMAIRPDLFDRPGAKPQEQEPAILFGVIAISAAIAVLLGWTLAALTVYSGRMIQRRRHRTFSLVMAGFLCMFAPFGTVLGVFTIVVLMCDSVRELYRANEMTAQPVNRPVN